MARTPHTPLMMAVWSGPPPMTAHALQNMVGAAEWLNRDDPVMGCTPLMACAFRDDAAAVAIAHLLVAAGADVNVCDEGPGVGPLFMAAQEDKPALCEFLCGTGARVDAIGRASPTTPLGVAAQNGCWRCCGALLRAARDAGYLGACVDMATVEGKTPCHVAVEMGHAECAAALAAAGADLRRASPRVYSTLDPADPSVRRCVDPTPLLEVHAATDAALQARARKTCAGCDAAAALQKCARCEVAYYCGRDCQKADWTARHRAVCSKLKRGRAAFGEMRKPARAAFGFAGAHGPEDYNASDAYDRATHPAWEYQDAKRDWTRYPPRIEEACEDMCGNGAPTFMYRPGDPDCDGMYERSDHRNPHTVKVGVAPPRAVATRHITFDDMTERDVYTGAARAVRRAGERKKGPRRRPPPFDDMRRGFL